MPNDAENEPNSIVDKWLSDGLLDKASVEKLRAENQSLRERHTEILLALQKYRDTERSPFIYLTKFLDGNHIL